MSGIHSLPVEMVDKIFLQLLEEDEPPLHRMKTLLLICSLDSAFRHIAVSNSSLWTHLVVYDDYKSLDSVKLYIQRSNPFPLHITIQIQSDPTAFDFRPLVLDVLAPASARTNTMKVFYQRSGPTQTADMTQMLSNLSMPELETLDVSGMHGIALPLGAVKLRSLGLYGFVNGPRLPSTIRKLRLGYGNGCGLPSTEVLRILNEGTSLETLAIEGSGDETGRLMVGIAGQAGGFNLSTLNTLSIGVIDELTFIQLTGLLNTPSLETVYVSEPKCLCRGPQTFLGFQWARITPNAVPSVRRLIISRQTYAPEEWMHGEGYIVLLARRYPNIMELRLPVTAARSLPLILGAEGSPLWAQLSRVELVDDSSVHPQLAQAWATAFAHFVQERKGQDAVTQLGHVVIYSMEVDTSTVQRLKEVAGDDEVEHVREAGLGLLRFH